MASSNTAGVPKEEAEPSVEDLVTQLMGQIKDTDWVQNATPLGVNIFDLAAESKAEREAAEKADSKAADASEKQS